MNKIHASATIIILLMAMSCTENNDLGPGSELKGTWRLYERGYSPGAGYVTEPVQPIPAQRLSLGGNYKMSTNIDNLLEYKYYRLIDDPNSESTILAFFKADPGSTPIDVTELDHSYNIEHENGNLKLMFRFCIEGCHLGFSREYPTMMD